MIEKEILDYLTGQLDVPVLMEMPEDRTVPVVLIQKTGSNYNRHTAHMAVIAIQSCADSMYGAALLNDQVKAAMDGFAALPEIGRVKLNTDYDFTDYTQATAKTYRYQAVYEIVHY